MPNFPLHQDNFERAIEQVGHDIERKRDEAVDKTMQKVQEQFATTTEDIVGGLYGIDSAKGSADPSEPGTEQIGQAAAQQQAAKQAAQKAASGHHGISQKEDQYIEAKHESGTPEQKEQIRKQKHAARHRSTYLAPILSWQVYNELDTQIDHIRQEREQQEAQRKQQEEEEKKQKEQHEEEKKQEQKKDSIEVDRAKKKTETFVGAAG